MSKEVSDRLYSLLPSIYRILDAQRGEPLRSLLRIIEREMLALEEDIDGLYDDWFIETCAPWVIPYIGDLLGIRNLHPMSNERCNLRSYVANTTAYRRRKGTGAVIEKISRDITGWPAHTVEFYEKIATTQRLDHQRLDNWQSPNLRKAAELELQGGPFEKTTRTIDVRSGNSCRRGYNIPGVGIFLWKLQSYPLIMVDARRKVGKGYCFDPTGKDIQLFNRPKTDTDMAHLSEEIDLPGPIRKRPLRDELERIRRAAVEGEAAIEGYFSSPPVFSIRVASDDGRMEEIRPEEMIICDLPDWSLSFPPEIRHKDRFGKEHSCKIRAAIDPKRGRLILTESREPLSQRVVVSYSYGFSGDIGAGPHDRSAFIRHSIDREVKWHVGVSQEEKEKEERYVFSWNEIPGNDDERLREFLTQGFLIDGIKTARIEKIDNGKTIKVSTENNSLSLKLNGKNDEVSLEIDGVRTREFIVKTEKGKLNIYEKRIFRTIGEAVRDWNKQPKGTTGIIAIMDSRTYNEGVDIEVPEGSLLIIVAADWLASDDSKQERRVRRNGHIAARMRRPHILGDIKVKGTASLESLEPGEILIDGLLVEGKLTVEEGRLGGLKVAHCTFLPGMLSIEVESKDERDNDALSLEIMQTICGGIKLPRSVPYLHVTESIVDHPNAEHVVDACGSEVCFEKSTILGEIEVLCLEASNSLFTDMVMVAQQQRGLVRCCYLPLSSRAPHRYRCQPDMALRDRAEQLSFSSPSGLSEWETEMVRNRLRPVFTSVHYGDPGYAQLAQVCAREIRMGSEDGSEMGVFCSLQHPQREANLRLALEEYLPSTLEAGIFFMN